MTQIEQPIELPQEVAEKYEIIDLIGEGANGKTWLALDKQTKQQVAIKSLKLDQVSDLKSIELFKREAATLSSIDLEGVPKYIGCCISEADGSYCIIQEYVRYPSIQTIIEQNGKFSEAAALNIIERVARVLYGLHSQYTPPIIHRDIKPSNILYNNTKTDDEIVDIWLIDFGAVANPQRRNGGSTVAGTFGYMAPEQMMGDACIQSDYYSLGATYFYMISGVEPWKLSTDVFNVDFESVLNEYASEVSAASIKMLQMLLSPVIEKRPQTPSELLKMIHYAQRGQIYDPHALQEDDAAGRSFWSRLVKFLKPTALDLKESRWLSTEGVIRANRMIYDYSATPYNAIEYTFNYEGIPYVGIYGFVDNKSREKIGEKCVVYFDPRDPRMNKL